MSAPAQGSCVRCLRPLPLLKGDRFISLPLCHGTWVGEDPLSPTTKMGRIADRPPDLYPD